MATKRDAPAISRQVGGSHYRHLDIQPFDYVTANGLGYAEGSVVYYVTRWRQKGGVEDLRKALHTLEMLIEHVEKHGANAPVIS